VVERFKAAGVERIAVGLDGWNAASHDGSRGIPGAFDSAMSALRTAREIGLDTQVHTTVTGANQHLLHEIAAVLEDVNPRIWTLALAGDEREKVFRDIYALSHAVSFDVRTDDARYRNYLARRLECLGEVAEPAGDHRGFIFISHTGEIHPGGFLPVSAGNIHDDLLVNVYRDSSLFRILSDHHEFLGGQQELGQHKYSEVRGLGLML
jgi:MoaA/NifB/PqqE/SkfB family radical SAM enzyme